MGEIVKGGNFSSEAVLAILGRDNRGAFLYSLAALVSRVSGGDVALRLRCRRVCVGARGPHHRDHQPQVRPGSDAKVAAFLTWF